MVMTTGDLKQASDWTRELVDSILYQQNRHQGAPQWVATTMFDWMKMFWQIGFREEGASHAATVWLTIPDEYGSSPGYMPNLRFDDLMDEIRIRLKSGGELLLADFEEDSLHTLGNTFRMGPAGHAVSSAGTHDSPGSYDLRGFSAVDPPQGPKVGDVIRVDGREMRVIAVSPSGVDVTLAPVEHTLDPEVLERERAIREAQEREAREIMLEALRRTGG